MKYQACLNLNRPFFTLNCLLCKKTWNYLHTHDVPTKMEPFQTTRYLVVPNIHYEMVTCLGYLLPTFQSTCFGVESNMQPQST
jgi:hypothetical protein